MYIDLQVKYPLFLSDFNKPWIFSTNVDKYLNIKFYENPSSGSRVVPCGHKGWYDEANTGGPSYPRFTTVRKKFGKLKK